MAFGEDHPPSQGDTQEKTKKSASHKRRGPTTAKYIMEDDDGPYALQWSDDGSAIGEFMNRYIAYTGSITRSKVKIHITHWSMVDEEIKERLWVCIKVQCFYFCVSTPFPRVIQCLVCTLTLKNHVFVEIILV